VRNDNRYARAQRVILAHAWIHVKTVGLDSMSDNWIEVAKVEDVPEEGTLRVAVKGEAVCLYNLGGKIYATHDTCTHAQASLADGFIEGENIECPLHQGLFHIPTGKAVRAPVTIDLRVYSIRVEEETIYVQASD
jgi:nitrite reductase/ring-hydroxylating ferredoxin subunit